MNAPTPPSDSQAAPAEEPAPACVMSFNASDASGAGGSAGDVATIAAMGAHALPVVTSIVVRDSAEIFDQHPIDVDAIAEQARTILEDVTIAGWKVGFLGTAEAVSAVAEILSDYPDVPLVSYLPSLGWIDEDELQSYLDAFPRTGPARDRGAGRQPQDADRLPAARVGQRASAVGARTGRGRRPNTARATCWSPA